MHVQYRYILIRGIFYIMFFSVGVSLLDPAWDGVAPALFWKQIAVYTFFWLILHLPIPDFSRI